MTPVETYNKPKLEELKPFSEIGEINNEYLEALERLKNSPLLALLRVRSSEKE